MCGRIVRPWGRAHICAARPACLSPRRPIVCLFLRSLSLLRALRRTAPSDHAPGGASIRLSFPECDLPRSRVPGGDIDRRALLQRARRSPIRPRRRRVEASARNVSPAMPDAVCAVEDGRIFMAAFLQEAPRRGKSVLPGLALQALRRQLHSLTARATSLARLGPSSSTIMKRTVCSAMMKEMSTFCDAAAMMAMESMPPGLVAR